MKLFDPISGVFADKLSHALAARPVKIERFAPFVFLIAEVTAREFAEVTAVGTEVVVDDVEDHADVQRVRRVDEGADVGGTSVEPRRRPEIDAVLSPAMPDGEVVHRQ